MIGIMKLFYVLALIFGIRASNFEGLDLISFDLESLLESEKISLPNYEKIEDLLTSFQPQNLEISNSSSTLHSEYEIGEVVRLKEDPQWTLLIQSFNEDKLGYVVTDEGTLKRYYVNASQLEKCPESQIDEYNEVKKAQFPIVGKRFILGGTLYDITDISIENREVWIEDVISGDSYHYRFDEQDKAILLDNLPLKHVNKKIALQSQDNIDHSPIPTPTSTEPTSRESGSVVSNEKPEEEPWKYFERNQLVQKDSTNKIYIFRIISKGKCRMVPLDDMSAGTVLKCNDVRAVTSHPEELKEWSGTGTVYIDLEMVAVPGDTLKVIGETPEILRSLILVSFSARKKGFCLLRDDSGTRYYVIGCKKLLPVNYECILRHHP